MNNENEQKLIAAAPKLYSGLHPERERMIESLTGVPGRPFQPIAFGFECGDGWFDLLLECSIKIEAIINSLPGLDQVGFYATQVKEKFGTLRFYMSYHTDEIDAIIAIAEEKSSVTCEVCGAPGQLRGNSWLSTTCDEHSDGKPVYSYEEQEK